MTSDPLSNNLSETRNAIQAFELILDAFPNDLATLEALFQTYESIGEEDKAKFYILKAGRVAIEQSGSPVSPALLNRLQILAPAHAEAAKLLASMGEEVLHPTPGVTSPVIKKLDEKKRRHPLEAEIALAWTLKEADLLSDTTYAQLVQDLTEGSVSERSSTVSLLEIMQSREAVDFEKVMNFIARDAEIAILPVASFETPDAIATILPLEFMVRNNIAVFESVGSELMIATLNPYDQSLQLEVEQRCARPCHFYLTLPSELKAWLQRIGTPKKSA